MGLVKYALKIAYDGAHFSGFQRQRTEGGPVTVQGELERALSKLFGEPIAVAGAGRTDTGVHALAQVVGFAHPRLWLPRDLGRGLQGVLREPIAVLGAARLPETDGFHPRHSARSRCYRYLLLPDCPPETALMLRHRAWCLDEPLDLDRLRAALPILRGEHDFSTFAFRPQAVPHCRRSLHRLEMQPWGEVYGDGPRMLAIELQADGFLRRMVRYLVAALVRVGTGRWEASDLARLLAARDNGCAPPPAPAHGLYLSGVGYARDPFDGERPESEVWRATQHRKTNWN